MPPRFSIGITASELWRLCSVLTQHSCLVTTPTQPIRSTLAASIQPAMSPKLWRVSLIPTLQLQLLFYLGVEKKMLWFLYFSSVYVPACLCCISIDSHKVPIMFFCCFVTFIVLLEPSLWMLTGKTEAKELLHWLCGPLKCFPDVLEQTLKLNVEPITHREYQKLQKSTFSN